jgi:AraC-like DNA-binding protein
MRITPPPSRSSPDGRAAETIRFDQRKYGLPLRVDACEIGDIPRFITAPRAHRLQFHEIALITGGAGSLELDGVDVDVAPGRVLLTGPGEIRRWRLRPGHRDRLSGWLVFFESDFVDGLFGDSGFTESLPLAAAPAAQRSLQLASRSFDGAVEIAAAMRDELRDIRPDSEHALRAETYRLLIALQRLSGARAAPADRARVLAKRFSALVATGLVDATSVGDCARRLGVTPRHLNHCLRRATGRTASETIQARQLLEARRLLLHSELSVGDIAEPLNFRDTSYFVRFFKRRAGTTPRRFRLRAG